MPTSLGILVFPEVEVLDFCGPFEAFSVFHTVGDDPQPLYKVHVIAETLDLVSCRNGLLVQPHFAIDEHPPLDMILVPGGFGTRAVVENRRLLDWVASHSASASLTMSVCTGSFVLGAVGLLDGKEATTHWGSIDRMREMHPATTVRENVRFVDQGAIVTSAGVSAGIDMALHVIERMHGREIAGKVARIMEYDWRP